MTDHEQTLKPGSQLEEFRIERVLGEGGFGITYLAFDTHFQKHVAIKEYYYAPWCFRSEGNSVKSRTNHKDDFKYGLDSFLQEARTLDQFKHPNIVKVIRFFEANGTAYIAMEYIEGQTLGSQIEAFKKESEEGMFNEEEMLFVLQPIIDGLKQLHHANVYHRDLKPDNIMLRKKGSPVLIDFGAAREATGNKSQNLSMIVTEGYSPLEQYNSTSKHGPWTDIYALAAVAYTCLTGEKPDESTHRILGDKVIPLVKAARDQGSLNFLKAVDNALAILPENRPQTLEEWWEQLTQGEQEDVNEVKATRGKDTYLKEIIEESQAKQGCQRLINYQGKKFNVTIPAGTQSGAQLKLAGKGEQGKNDGENGDLYIEIIVEKTTLKLILGGSLVLLMIIGLGIIQKDNLEQWVTDYRHKQEKARQQRQAEKQKAIETLLAGAEANIKQLRLSSPKGNNAVEKYQQVLQLEAANNQAQQGLKAIITKYLQLAEQAQQHHDYSQATQHLKQAAKINADDPDLVQAEQTLNSEQQAYEAEQQRQIEIARQAEREAEQQRLAALKAEQEAQARKKSKQADEEKKRKISEKIVMIRITPHCFQMGSDTGYYVEKPVHQVCITQSYEIGKYEVTQAQWKKVMGNNPSHFKGDNKPVESVSWNDIQDFIRKLNQQTGQNYRLPTEAEWEYACRSGGRYYETYCGGNDISVVAWYGGNSGYGATTHEVGQTAYANGLGLYDMSGNVWEWLSDWDDGDYYQQSPTNDPRGPSSGSGHVIRGGGFRSDAADARSTSRGKGDDEVHYTYGDGVSSDDLGFRLARTYIAR